jgi:hypothetical protein
MKNLVIITEIFKTDRSIKLLLGFMVADALLLIALVIIAGALLLL